MVKNIQCPVCTLYLHAGMNLCDHLETHPKEQVIKALVHMTISGNEKGSLNIDSSELIRSQSIDQKLNENSIYSPTIKDHDLNSICSSGSASSNTSIFDQSLNNTSLNFNESNTIDGCSISSSLSSKTSVSIPCDVRNEVKYSNKGRCQQQHQFHQHYPRNTPKASNMQDLGQSIGANSSEHYNDETLSMSAPLNSEYSYCMVKEYKRTDEEQHSMTTVTPETITRTQSTTSDTKTVCSLVKSELHTEIPTMLPTSLPLPLTVQLKSASSSQRQCHTYSNHPSNQQSQIASSSQHHKQQQQQNHNHTAEIHHQRPPTFQLYKYQTSSSAQHLKPPPAYGTAISQIRSQNKHNKQAIRLAETSQEQPQEASKQEDFLDSSLRHHSLVNPSPSITYRNQQQKSSNSVTYSASLLKRSGNSTKGNLENSLSVIDNIPSGSAANKPTRVAHLSTAIMHAQVSPFTTSTPTPTPTSMSTSTSTSTSISNPAATTSTIGRHTNNVVVTNTALSTSASSVLCYAESPVAHYLERDNGDFIVQETPKHIMEYVEKEDGKFSVIERIYQSPPSVLRIHDEDIDDDDDVDIDDDDDDKKDNISNDATNAIDSNHKSSSGSGEMKSGTSGANKPDDNDDFISNTSADEPKPSTVCKTEEYIPEADEHIVNGSCSKTKVTPLASKISVTTPTTPRKKSSKNTITVLSDVSLNLNEYLDLVGNIMASSKISARGNISSITSIPTVKIEKVEPPDDEEFQAVAPNKQETDKTTDLDVNVKHGHSATIDGNRYPEKKSSNRKLVTTVTGTNGPSASTSVAAKSSSYSGHATSVIRMATTTTTTTSPPKSKTLHSDDILQIEEEQPTCMNTAMKCEESNVDVEDLSQTATNHTESNGTSVMANSRKSYGKSLVRKPPKKLIIKPKLIKTTKVMSLSKDVINAAKAPVVMIDDDQKPSTSAKALSEFEQKQRSMSFQTKRHPPSDINSNGEVNYGLKAVHQLPAKNTEKITWYSTANNRRDINDSKDAITRLTINRTFHEESVEQELKKEKKTHDTSNESSSSSATFINCNTNKDKMLNSKEIGVKNEPIFDSLTDVGTSVMIMDFEEEKPRLIESTIIALKTEDHNNMNEDAQVLYEFAKSNKEIIKDDAITSGSAQNRLTLRSSANHGSNIQSTSEIPSNTISEASILDSSSVLSSISHNSLPTNAATTNSQQNQISTFIDYPFGFLYNSNQISPQISSVCSIKQDQSEQEHANHSTSSNEWFNSNDANNSTSASTTAPFSKNIAELQNSTTTLQVDYYNNTSGGDDRDADGDVSRYLDLDACKQEHKFDMTSSVGCSVATTATQPSPSSPASCSFNGHNTDNSLVGICYQSSGLNIRTDEKMPAKGEISEQESNCDIENSWSQPMNGEIPGRFFKTSSPGIFTHDSGWNHDDYFAAQDLSASSATHVDFVVQSRPKSFEFYLPADANSDSNAMTLSYNPNGLPIFSHSQNPSDVVAIANTELLPSTSSKIKNRKRKRTLLEDKAIASTTATTTATVTAAAAAAANIGIITQQQQQQQQEQSPEHLLQQHLYIATNEMSFEQQQQIPTTSATNFLMVPNTSLTDTGVGMDNSMLIPRPVQQKARGEKTYECARCFAKYNKLKDRNAHMIEVHKYIRQNRKLICPPQTLVTSTVTSNPNELSELAPSTSAAMNSSQLQQNNEGDHLCEDSKQGIVKIETEPSTTAPLIDIKPDFALKTKLEVDENKQNMNLVAMSSTTPSLINANSLDVMQQLQYKEQNSVDVKCADAGSTNLPGLPGLANTNNSKQTSMYRMLIAYNMNNLKMKQELPDIDEKFIQSLIFYCHICRQSFSSIKQYDIHLTEHPAECFSCGKQFQRWKNLSLHLKRHMGWKEFACNVCEKKFVVRSALVEHMRMHSGHSPLKCKVCGKNFKRYSNLTQHRKRHFKKTLRRKEYVCYCGEVLPSKARFLWHKETHDSKPKCCPHCCDRFVHVNSLKRHIRLAHSDKFDYIEPVECSVCKQVFAKTSMKSHMATHTADNQYDCTLCNKSFSTKWNLKVHSWVHANRTAKPFKCEYCPKAFVREVDFKNHMNSHKQIRPYTCEVCGCKFIRKYNYMRHRREHHGDKKFTCDLCKKSFHRHYYLIEHRRIHTGERPFQCSICGKSSTTKTNHNKHMKIHHSRDPFTVEV